MKTLLFIIFSSCIGLNSMSQQPQKIEGVFCLSTDSAIKLIISKTKFAYVDLRKRGDLATPCCDTITYGDVSYDSSGFLIIKSDASLSSIFIGINVVEGKKEGSDSNFF
jgi:hypothetical protein